MVCIYTGGDIGMKGLEKNNEWLKKIRKERKGTHSQVPTTLEHVMLIILLATPQLQN